MGPTAKYIYHHIGDIVHYHKWWMQVAWFSQPKISYCWITWRCYIMWFYPVRWDSFNLVCFICEANDDVLLVLTSRWRSFLGLFLSTTPIPVPPLSVSSYPWWEEFLQKLHSTPQRQKTCRRLNRGRTERVEKQNSLRLDFYFLVFGLFFFRVFIYFHLPIKVYRCKSLYVKCSVLVKKWIHHL